MSLLLGTLSSLPDLVATGSPNPTGVTSPTGLKPPSEIQRSIVGWILPLILIVVAVMSVKFLFQRQMTQFFQFLGITLLVFVVMLNPDILQKIAEWFGTILK